MSEQFPYSFGKYRVEAEIGRGGFGTVFRAVDVALDRAVAIKIMDPIYMRDQRWVARFRQEARVMARLDHPHIVPIYEISEEEGRLYLAMKIIDGPDLTKMIAQQGALPWRAVVDLTGQITSALDFAHKQHVIHRDLKPGNILVSNGQAMLTDFGLASMVEENSMSISMTGGVAGTYNYMPPEVFNNEEVTAAADVYALGCVLYEMLAGRMLVEGKSTAAIIGAHLKGISFEEPLPEGTPPGTRELLLTALAKDPLDRYASAGELFLELQRLSEDRLTSPYARLEQAMAGQQWQEALALAAEIRAQDSTYRDVVALEERAQRAYWSAQWQTETRQAVAEDNFDAARGALSQWHRVDPDDPQLPGVEKELALAEQYVGLQQLITEGKWDEAQSTAVAIYAQDPSFRDIVALQAKINVHFEPPPGATSASALKDTPQEDQDRSAAGAAVAGAPEFSHHDNIAAAAPASVAERKPQESASATSAGATPHKKKGAGVPAWTWWVGAIVVVLLLAFGIRAILVTRDLNTPPPDPTLGSEWVRPQDQMTMVYVPQGTFLMGSEDGDVDEDPVHKVTLDGFWIDYTEVTNDLYQSCVDEGECEASSNEDNAAFHGDAYPVVGVSWYDADAYCQWVGGQLPSEAQWEYAARGSEGNTYPWGEEEPTCELAQYFDCGGETMPAGSYPEGKSWVGALDMAGNVWEWVNDWYDSETYANSAAENPAGPESGSWKVLRGGGWTSTPVNLRGANRYNYGPDTRSPDIGFRCAAPGR